MFKEGHDRTKFVFQNYHLRIGGVNSEGRHQLADCTTGQARNGGPELGQWHWRQRQRHISDGEKWMEARDFQETE